MGWTVGGLEPARAIQNGMIDRLMAAAAWTLLVPIVDDLTKFSCWNLSENTLNRTRKGYWDIEFQFSHTALPNHGLVPAYSDYQQR